MILKYWIKNTIRRERLRIKYGFKKNLLFTNKGGQECSTMKQQHYIIKLSNLNEKNDEIASDIFEMYSLYDDLSYQLATITKNQAHFIISKIEENMRNNKKRKKGEL